MVGQAVGGLGVDGVVEAGGDGLGIRAAIIGELQGNAAGYSNGWYEVALQNWVQRIEGRGLLLEGLNAKRGGCAVVEVRSVGALEGDGD